MPSFIKKLWLRLCRAITSLVGPQERKPTTAAPPDTQYQLAALVACQTDATIILRTTPPYTFTYEGTVYTFRRYGFADCLGPVRVAELIASKAADHGHNLIFIGNASQPGGQHGYVVHVAYGNSAEPPASSTLLDERSVSC